MHRVILAGKSYPNKDTSGHLTWRGPNVQPELAAEPARHPTFPLHRLKTQALVRDWRTQYLPPISFHNVWCFFCTGSTTPRIPNAGIHSFCPSGSCTGPMSASDDIPGTGFTKPSFSYTGSIPSRSRLSQCKWPEKAHLWGPTQAQFLPITMSSGRQTPLVLLHRLTQSVNFLLHNSIFNQLISFSPCTGPKKDISGCTGSIS